MPENISTTLDEIELALAGHAPGLLEPVDATLAAVALIVSDGPAGPRLLFIERAANDNDPWSGHICFPGGKVENGDRHASVTAQRETLEEIGLDLANARLLGRLSDIAGTRIPVHVSCFVYRTEETGPFRLMSEEVKESFWVSLEDLRDPARHGYKMVSFDGQDWIRPCITLPHPGEPVLWGLTYQLVMDFLEVLHSTSHGN
ncbi:MAG: CoA pyrophosphatase [Geobacteraceae bacterium]|nr:CoA pyrophosphatase [Geobacteraceae bacterium]